MLGLKAVAQGLDSEALQQLKVSERQGHSTQ